jgi:large subunit ribosomal protein L25
VAETYTLDAQLRTITGKKVSQLRGQGLVPAVIYGAKFEPVHVQIPHRALQLTLLKAGGTHLINMNVGDSVQTVITREVQRHVLRGDIMHVDFLAVDATTLIETEVPVHFINESPAVQTKQGILVTGMNTVRVEALPADLIYTVEIDLSKLMRPGDAIHVRDLSLGAKIRIVSDPDEVVVRVAVTAAAESEEAESAEAVSAEPEVIARGKQEEEDF